MANKQPTPKYRTSLSSDEVNLIVNCFELAYPNGIAHSKSLLYITYRKFKSQAILLQEGLMEPDYTTKPRMNIVDKMDFDGNPIPARRVKTQEEIDAEIASFDQEAFFAKIQAQEQQSQSQQSQQSQGNSNGTKQ